MNDHRSNHASVGKPARRCAYVLLVVLIVLLVATTVLVRAATQAMREASHSLTSTRNLQAKWGRISCQAAILPIADQIFESADRATPAAFAGSRPARGKIRESLMLGGQSVTLLLSDENTKLNVNTLRRAAGQRRADELLKRFIPAQYLDCLRSADTPTPSQASRLLGSWGELLDLNRASLLAGDDRVLAEMTTDITLWGSGRLNVSRAPTASIKALCESVAGLSTAERILDRLDQRRETLDLDILIQSSTATRTEQELLKSVLATSSDCFALWIETIMQDGRRIQYHAISTTDTRGNRKRAAFALD